MSVIVDWLVDFVFPKLCVICGKEGSFLCRKCKKNLPGALQICPMCTRPSIYGLTHEYCRKKSGLKGLMAVFDYKNQDVKKVIEAIKFGFNQDLVKIVLAGWRKPKSWGSNVVLVPVPLHRYRQNWRGFNQAELIARAVGGKKVVMVLKRTRATAQQAGITGREKRLANLKGCFAVDMEKLALVRGKRVVLVDDVFTSGATMRECARELHRVGIRQIWGFCLAR